MLGVVSLNKEIYEPILEYINRKSKVAILSIAEELEGKVNLHQIFEACIILSGKGYLCLAQEDEVIESSKSATDNLNAFFIKQSLFEPKVDFLTSPVTSTALFVSRFEQMFLSVLENNSNKADDIALKVLRRLKLQNEKMISDGKVLGSDQENIEFLKTLASQFLTYKLPTLTKLKIV